MVVSSLEEPSPLGGVGSLNEKSGVGSGDGSGCSCPASSGSSESSHWMLPPAAIVRSKRLKRVLGTFSEYTLPVCKMPNTASRVWIGKVP